MLWIVLAQNGDADFGIVEEVRGKRAKFYNLEGVMGVWWGKERQYYRGDLAFQMQYDEGFYGRFSLVSFNEYPPLWSVGVKELYVEKVFDNGFDVKFGLGAIYWENGLLFGDYIGGNPFLDVFFGKSVWVDLLAYRVDRNLGAGVRGAVDLGNFGFTVYGVYNTYDTLRTGYIGISTGVDVPFLTFSLEATGEKDSTDYEGAYILYAFLRPGMWFAGLMSYSFTEGFDRIVAQGLDLDPDRSPFFGVSTPLTYDMPGIPWTNPQNTSAEVLRFGFNYSLNEDWTVVPMFDLGTYQSVAMDIKHNSLMADFHLRLNWTDTYYVGFSAGTILTDSIPNWGFALYSVKTFSF